MIQLLSTVYQRLLSNKTKKISERVILSIAIVSFLVHLLLIYLVDFGIIQLDNPGDLLGNPIAAIYTPFSFILVYEVYLLLYYLPKSITTYISKQYEIITLIIIRRLFKDLSNLTISPDWFSIKYDLQFTYDLVASVLLFFLILLFYKQSKVFPKVTPALETEQQDVKRFIRIKKAIAGLLVPILVVLAFYSFINWSMGVFVEDESPDVSFENINNIFFEQFFTILIITDVILLLVSFFYTDQFHKVIRNSGFIISTILIRLSFSVTGLLNVLLIITAIVFGLLILVIHNKFEKSILASNEPAE
ncbi:MAG: hypothetical protein ACXITV_10030 [Luteibaculaceae bacterium]